VSRITANAPLVYKTFLLHNKQTSGGAKTRKIRFEGEMSEAMSPEEYLNNSYKSLQEEGGLESKTELYKVNPTLFRNLKYFVTISPDVLNPRSEELERAYGLEFYDRAIANPIADQEEAFRRLLRTDPIARKDPEKFIAKQRQQPLIQQGNISAP